MTKEKIVLDGLLLFSKSDYHKHYTVEDLEKYLLYPAEKNSIRVFYRNKEPVGLVTWCWLSKDNAKRFLSDNYHTSLDDYDPALREGKDLWGMEFIAPYGDTRKIMSLVRKECLDTYGETTVHWRRFHDRSTERKGRFK